MEGRLRIVLVPGPSANAARLEAMLGRDRAVEVVLAATGPALEELLREDAHAVVVALDRSDVEIDAVLGVVTRRAPDVPVIVVAQQADERLARSLRDGATDYVLAGGDIASVVRRARARQDVEQVRRQDDKHRVMATLLGHVAHELNNPLGILVGQADLLMELMDKGPLRERAQKLVEAAERCGRMIKDFLLVARRLPLECERLDPARLLRDTLQTCASTLARDDIELDVQLDPSLPPINADRYQLQKAILSLVANAQEAMRAAPGPRTLRCRAEVDAAAGVLRLAISDTGPGLPEAARARIFEPFFALARDTRGTGLGLALVQSVVEAHGGAVTVTSGATTGATFVLALPIAGDGPGPVPRDADMDSASVNAASILLVEDKPEVANVLTDMLSIDGHRVETAPDGRGALHKLDEASYDVVVTDVRMPGLDGPGLYRELEQRHPRLKHRVIFCTGEALAQETQKLLERLDAPVIFKPFAVDALRRAIRRVLAVEAST